MMKYKSWDLFIFNNERILNYFLEFDKFDFIDQFIDWIFNKLPGESPVETKNINY